jgi:hypothetical protein
MSMQFNAETIFQIGVQLEKIGEGRLFKYLIQTSPPPNLGGGIGGEIIMGAV